RISQRLGGHEPDAQARVTSWSATDYHAREVGGSERFRFQNGLNCRSQIASVAAAVIQRHRARNRASTRQADHPDAAGGFQDEPVAVHFRSGGFRRALAGLESLSFSAPDPPLSVGFRMSDTATMHIDGAARGNPGPAAYAVVLERPGQPAIEE